MTRNTRPSPLEVEHEGKRFVRFDPTFNAGTIAQIVVILASAVSIYTGIRTDQVQTKADVDAVKAAAVSDREQTKAALADLKTDVKELRQATADIKESLAILRGRAADSAGAKR